MNPSSLRNQEELDALTDRFSDAEIASNLGLTRTAVTYWRKKLNVKSFSQKQGVRKYKDFYEPKENAKRVFSYKKLGVNESYFSKIDTQAKAYWLGLLMADGWIVTETDVPKGFAIALNKRDKKILDLFARDLGCSDAVKDIHRADLHQIKITSSLMAKDLIKHGIVPRKSFVAVFPNIQVELYSDFIRGYFDGDGHVSLRNGSLSAQFTSASQKLLQQLQSKLEAVGISSRIHKDRNSYVLRLYGKNAKKLGYYMYSSDNVEYSFSRKREKFFGYQGSGAGHSWKKLPSGLDSSSSR